MVGTYSLGNQNACTPCPAGFTCAETDTAEMDACVAGTYSPLGSPTCTNCPAGSSCSNASVNPVTCLSGYYSSGGAEDCTPCPAGKQCSDPAVSPQNCPAGYYSAGVTNTCSPCTPGYLCGSQSTETTPASDICPMGGYCSVSTTFTPCPEGTMGTITGGTSQSHACQSCSEVRNKQQIL